MTSFYDIPLVPSTQENSDRGIRCQVLSYPGIIAMERYFTELATAFVRGRLNQPDASIEAGLEAGLRLHKFKRNTELPRVRTVLGILRGLLPENLLDIGSGRGTFLWPLLASFPRSAAANKDAWIGLGRCPRLEADFYTSGWKIETPTTWLMTIPAAK